MGMTGVMMNWCSVVYCSVCSLACSTGSTSLPLSSSILFADLSASLIG